ncbi:hypothetical protein SYNPS1DRAFT_32043 [Syncephalis pseudoplumigaleata]|uniref:Uncharacterized protein n=1 Tax=Syncephalis pseudoplumigaleata TaxID=1712513 RepID=A0A4P9YRM2_9FUNG|nr:hypothetical protein SYNPS1DRAFT_32043 [Syncephalis pseudoplumigaleata]|eukprot:RKP22374.1 hypothetical protein SYNPS1DRAFT_32043 [Syncephalis pseudoplumigaleata]
MAMTPPSHPTCLRHQPLLLFTTTIVTITLPSTATERLIAAARQNNLDLLNEALQEAGSTLDVNTRDAVGHTALLYAAEFGAVACLTSLLQQPGIAIELRDRLQHETSLLHSCKSTHIGNDATRKACVAALLQAGANPSVRDGSGRLPEELVENEEIRQMLRQARMTQRLGTGDIVDDDDDDDDDESEGEASD